MRDDAKYIEKVDVKNYLFFDDFSFDFCKSDGKVNQWTVLLGENGSGKTSILKSLSDLNPWKLRNENLGVISPDVRNMNPKQNSIVPKGVANSIFYTLISKISSYGDTWGWGEGTFAIDRKMALLDFLIYGYGVSRYSSDEDFSKSKVSESTCYSIFINNCKLLNLSGWILKVYLAKQNGNQSAVKQYPIIHSVLCESRLFDGLTDFQVVTDDHYDTLVKFKYNQDWVEYENLPAGYQTMLSWVGDFCYRMFDRYKDSENPLHEPAIVLIDEIDLNLHPEWQRKIVPLLSEAFPNTQFIATTHSPFVIQSMEDVNLYVLSRDESGKGLITRVPGNNFTGWSVEEILTDIMGLDERINSDKYNELMAKFDDGLDNDDKQKVEEAYSALCAILPPNSKTRKVIDYQKKKVC